MRSPEPAARYRAIAPAVQASRGSTSPSARSASAFSGRLFAYFIFALKSSRTFFESSWGPQNRTPIARHQWIMVVSYRSLPRLSLSVGTASASLVRFPEYSLCGETSRRSPEAGNVFPADYF